MTHHLRFFDDYGSGWLWPGDRGFGAGPVDAQLAGYFAPETLALSAALLERSAASLNPEYPPDGCPWPLHERQAFDAAADALLRRMRADLGQGFSLTDERQRLAP